MSQIARAKKGNKSSLANSLTTGTLLDLVLLIKPTKYCHEAAGKCLGAI